MTAVAESRIGPAEARRVDPVRGGISRVLLSEACTVVITGVITAGLALTLMSGTPRPRAAEAVAEQVPRVQDVGRQGEPSAPGPSAISVRPRDF